MPELPANTSDERQYHSTQRSSFRTAPWFILGEKDIKSKGTALVLSVLWAAAQGDRNRNTRLSNEEISRRSGIRGGAQAALKHLQKLEKLGYIKRQGSHKNRAINILIQPETEDIKGLTIPPDIFVANLSPTQKLIASIRQALPNMEPRNICNWLGITLDTYYHNVKKCCQPYKESLSNPIKNPCQPYKESLTLGREGRERVELISKDINRRTTCADNDFPTDSTGGLKMIHSETYGKEYDSILTQTLRNKKAPSRSAELENLFSTLPNNTKHKPGTKAYEDAKRTIRALTLSPAKILKPSQIAQITQAMAKSNGRPGYSQKQINEFLNHKFSIIERTEIYQRLSNYHDPIYRAKAVGKCSLGNALHNPYAEGFSLIMEVWYHPPKPIRIPTVIIDSKLLPVVDMVMETIQAEDRKTEASVKKNIKHLHWLYEKTIRPRMTEETKYHYGDFPRYMKGFVDWAIDKYSGLKPTPGWFSSDSKPFHQWERKMREWTNSSEETSEYLTECLGEL
jgi:hypothetical protein